MYVFIIVFYSDLSRIEEASEMKSFLTIYGFRCLLLSLDIAALSLCSHGIISVLQVTRLIIF